MTVPDDSLLDAQTNAATRLVSLDAFRGGVIVLMLLVNHTFAAHVTDITLLQWAHGQLFHVPWDDPEQGVTLADLVFPWFIFVAGAAVPLSLASKSGQGRPWWRTILRVLRRGIVLYLLGCLLTVASAAYTRPLVWGDLLTWNILQLIAAAYVICVGVFMLPRSVQIVFVFAVLVGKTALMIGVAWSTTETHDTIRTFHDVKQWVNQQFGWWGGAQQFLPAATIAVFGAWTTQVMRSEVTTRRKVRQLVIGGGVLLGVGVLLGAGYEPGLGGWLGPLTIPASKWLFSPAYCLVAAGSGAVLYAGCWLLLDVATLRRWSGPLLVFGRNALVLYVASELVFKVIISKWTVATPTGGTANLASAVVAWLTHATGHLAAGVYGWCLLWLTLWWLILRWMDRNKIRLRV